MKPFSKGILPPPSEKIVSILAQRMKVSMEEARRIIDDYNAKTTVWINDIYQVQRREHADDGVHLNIRRRDGKPIFRDWRQFQQIKNELIGPECEAVELYPAESRLVDTSNKYHLWGCSDPTYRFPIGLDERDVSGDDGERQPGFRQRPLNNGAKS